MSQSGQSGPDRPIDGLVLEEFSIYEGYKPHIWNILLMTDLAVQLHEANRRLDAIDRKILTVLQEDASLSVAEIGDRVGLSSTPCWKRIQRLEADGVILRRVALVDQNKIGLGISVFVLGRERRSFRGLAEDLRRCAVSAMPEVMEFYRMAGDVDYMLRVVVADMAELRRVLQKADQRRAAEERHLALCDGEDQVGHRACRIPAASGALTLAPLCGRGLG